MRLVVFHVLAFVFRAFIACCAVVSMHAQSVWTRQLPPERLHYLGSMDFVDAKTGMAVGYGGIVVKTSDAGTTWTIQQSGTMAWMYDVSMANDLVAIAIGVGGTIIRTTNGGKTWTTTTIPSPMSLEEISFSDDVNATVVGMRGGGGVFSGVLLRTTDAGISWNEQVEIPDIQLHDVSFSDAGVGVAVGDSGTILRSTDGGATWAEITSGTEVALLRVAFADDTTAMIVAGDGGVAFWSRDAGVTWTIDDITDEDFFPGWVSTISFADDLHGVVSIPRAVYRTTDGGDTWSKHTFVPDAIVRDVLLFDNRNGYAIGDAGCAFRTTDGGATWTSLRKGLVDNLNSVSFSDSSNGTTVGEAGVILRTTDSGLTWERENSGTTEPLTGVFLTSANAGTAVSARGVFLKRDGESAVWKQTHRDSGYHSTLHVFFGDDMLGYAAALSGAGFIWRTMDGGNSWIRIETNITFDGIRKIYFTDAGHGVALLNRGAIWATADGGVQWTNLLTGPEDSPHVYDIHVRSATTMYIVGASGMIARTTDAGLTWTAQHSGTQNYLAAVDFFDNDNGIAVGGYGTIVRTTNGGETWVVEECLTEFSINDVEFTSLNSATAVGDVGLVLHGTFTNVPASVNVDAHALSDIIRAYPNPADEAITIEIATSGHTTHAVAGADNVDVYTIDIYDCVHNLVHHTVRSPLQTGHQSVTIPTHGLSNGFYYCRLQCAGAMHTAAFVVSR